MSAMLIIRWPLMLFCSNNVKLSGSGVSHVGICCFSQFLLLETEYVCIFRLMVGKDRTKQDVSLD